MSLEITSASEQKERKRYDQLTEDTAITTPNLNRSSSNREESKSDQNSKSKNETQGSSRSNSDNQSSSERSVNSETVIERGSVNYANIAFNISFSISLIGRFPTDSASNC